MLKIRRSENNGFRSAFLRLNARSLASLACFVVVLIIQSAQLKSSFFGVNKARTMLAAASRSDAPNGATTKADTSAISTFHMGEPLKLELRLPEYGDQSARVIIASAIKQPNLSIVVFVVYEKGITIDGYEEKRQAIPALPDKALGCVFSNEMPAVPSTLTTPHSYVQVLGITQRFVNSTTVWMCQIPPSQADASSVTILASSSWATKLHGYGFFPLMERGFAAFNDSHDSATNASPKGRDNAITISLCNQGVFNLDNTRAQDVKEFVDYYRTLGVGQFTFYLLANNMNDLATLKQATRPQHPTTTRYRPDISVIIVSPSLESLMFEEKIWMRPNYFVSKYATNDCLWRNRAAGIEWTMQMFDTDEFLIGTNHLPTYLSTNVSQHEGIMVMQHLVQDFHIRPRMKSHLLVARDHSPTWGKTIHRSAAVDVSWTHTPTSPKINLQKVPELKLLHFRNTTGERAYSGFMTDLKYIETATPLADPNWSILHTKR